MSKFTRTLGGLAEILEERHNLVSVCFVKFRCVKKIWKFANFNSQLTRKKKSSPQNRLQLLEFVDMTH
jgi:hypothetical protein